MLFFGPRMLGQVKISFQQETSMKIMIYYYSSLTSLHRLFTIMCLKQVMFLGYNVAVIMHLQFLLHVKIGACASVVVKALRY